MATTQKVSPEQVLDALAAHAGGDLGGTGRGARHRPVDRGQAPRRPRSGGHGPPRARRARGRPAAGRPVEHHDARRRRHRVRRRRTEGSGDATAADSTGGEPTRSADRLGRGALGALVREYLAARPGEDLGPTQIGKALGRSQGAVSNALARLEAGGEARLVSASPRRYRIVGSR